MADVPSNQRTLLVPASPTSGEGSGGHRFCPVGGLFGKSSLDFHHEIRCLLASRLRGALSILLGGFAAFLVRNFFVDLPAKEELLLPHTGVVAVLAGLLALMVVRRDLGLVQLRAVELAAFGVPAAFFVWLQYWRVVYCPVDLQSELARAWPGETVIPWLILIQVYGFFIPNTWKRAALVVTLMSLAPLLGAWASANYSSYVRAVLLDGQLSAMILWMAIGAAISIYGTHRFGLLRREAFDAKRLGVYTLRERLGSGGMGDVYVAEHQLLKRRCAIKLIRPEKAGDENAMARFESEVQAAAKLTHPNTIEIYDYGVTRDGTFYYVMEYLPGLNLQEIVERFGPLPPERVVHLLAQVCSALQEAHGSGLIHRDIKPGNIFAAERGGLYDFAKLLDFGLVKSIKPEEMSVRLTQDGAVVGSPLFAAPEAAIDGEPDERSDVYSLGATAYYLLSGRAVFEGENPLKVLFAHSHEQPRPVSHHLPDVPADLEAVIMRCLQKKPEARYQTIAELQAALEACELPRRWTQQRARDWWSQTPRDAAGEVGTGVSAEAAETAVMHVAG